MHSLKVALAPQTDGLRSQIRTFVGPGSLGQTMVTPRAIWNFLVGVDVKVSENMLIGTVVCGGNSC